ncbi:hypothetical protein TrRE_jg2003, partial [Triparma retinervis]
PDHVSSHCGPDYVADHVSDNVSYHCSSDHVSYHCGSDYVSYHCGSNYVSYHCGSDYVANRSSDYVANRSSDYVANRGSEHVSYRDAYCWQAYGKVLELGPGPGTNFRCYEDAKIEQLTGIEPNEYFKAELMAEKAKQNLTFPVEQRWLRGEELDVEPGTFDSVVGTHVLCTVEDVVGVLSNVKKAMGVC